MSLRDYRISRHLLNQGHLSFTALLMAAMGQAGPEDLVKLQGAFYDEWNEFFHRSRTPGGWLPGEAERLVEAIRQA